MSRRDELKENIEAWRFMASFLAKQVSGYLKAGTYVDVPILEGKKVKILDGVRVYELLSNRATQLGSLLASLDDLTDEEAEIAFHAIADQDL